MRWLGAIVLSVLVIVGLLTLLGQGPAVPGLGLGTTPTSEGATGAYAAENARLVQTDASGTLQYVVTAERMTQDPDSDDVTAQNVRLDYARESPGAAQPWVLTAREGRVPGGGTQIKLVGDVKLVGRPNGSNAPVRVETRALDFDLATQIAHTTLPVNFYWGARRLNARGLNADLKRGTLRLESSVHGRFPP